MDRGYTCINDLVDSITVFESEIIGDCDGRMPPNETLEPLGLTRVHINKLLRGALTSSDDIDWELFAKHFRVTKSEIKAAIDIRGLLKTYGSLDLKEIKRSILKLKDIVDVPENMREFVEAFFMQCSKVFNFTSNMITFHNEVIALPTRNSERSEIIINQSQSFGFLLTIKQVLEIDKILGDISHQVITLQREGVIGQKIGRSIVSILYDLFRKDWAAVCKLLGIRVDCNVLKVIAEHEISRKNLGRIPNDLTPKHLGEV